MKKFDAFPKTLQEFNVKTVHGGLLSLFALFSIMYLLLSEFRFYFQMETIQTMSVDGTRHRNCSIQFDIDFPKMPCSLLSIDVEDMLGVAQANVDSNIARYRLDLKGNRIGPAVPFTMGGGLKNESHISEIHNESADVKAEKRKCGSCYGAGEPNECCNTCDQVIQVYKKKGWSMPSLHTVEQCARSDFEAVVNGNTLEGCNVHGSIKVPKVAGKLVFGPGQIFQHGYLHVEDTVDFTFKNFDNSHHIQYLVFGEKYPDMKNPLGGRKKDLDDNDHPYGTFQYYLKIVSTEFRYFNDEKPRVSTNQYSVTEHFKKVFPRSGRGLPSVALMYEFDPVNFELQQVRKGYFPFFTGICAIFGGVFTIVGLIDAAVFSYANKRDAILAD